jgi:hypothetical protein
MTSSSLDTSHADSEASSDDGNTSPTNTTFQTILFGLPRKKSLKLTSNNALDRPTSPTSRVNSSFAINEPPSPAFSSRSSHRGSISSSGGSPSWRRTSIFSLLTNSSRKASMTDDSGDEFHPENEQKSGSFSSRKGSRWGSAMGHHRKSSKSQRLIESMNGVDHPNPSRDDSANPIGIGISMPPQSHEVAFLDSVIPEEGLPEEEEESCNDRETAPLQRASGPGRKYQIEWFSSEEAAQRRTTEILRGRERGSGHWLHSTGESATASNGSAKSTSSQSDGNDEKEPGDDSKTKSGTSFLGKLSSMAGLSSNHSKSSEQSKRDRASSLPNRRKSSKKLGSHSAGSGAAAMMRNRSKSIAAPNMTAYRDAMESETPEPEKHASGKKGSVAFAGPLQKAHTSGSPAASSSMWDNLQKQGRKMREFSIFGPGRGEYASVATAS